LSVGRSSVGCMVGVAWPVSELDNYELLSHAARVESLAVIQRLQAQLDAREQVLLHAMHADPVPNIDGSPAVDKQWVREDVACAKRVSPQTAALRLHNATDLVTRLPATLALLAEGGISLQHANRLVDAIRGLPQEIVCQGRGTGAAARCTADGAPVRGQRAARGHGVGSPQP